MATPVPTPYFPNPPEAYDPRYMAEVVRAFTVFAAAIRNPGPQRATELVLTVEAGNVDTGKLTYSSDEDTFELTHLNDVVQRVGFSTYMRATNNTGATIAKATAVGLNSAASGEITIAKTIADRTDTDSVPIGLTAFSMDDGDTGAVIIYGKLTGVDATGAGVSETWAAGDTLYVSPDTAGALTKVKPTAPDTVFEVGVVLVADATAGEIMVRPVPAHTRAYGLFTATADQTLVATNTATNVVLDTTEAATGVSLGTPASRVVVDAPGLYEITVSVQFARSGAGSGNAYVWLAKNGTAVTNSTRHQAVNSSSDEYCVTFTWEIVLAASDYIEVQWASTSTSTIMNYVTGLSFAPDVPSAIVAVTQVQM